MNQEHSSKEIVERFIERIGADPNDPIMQQLIEKAEAGEDHEMNPTVFHRSMMTRTYLQSIVPVIRDRDNAPETISDEMLEIVAQWYCLIIGATGQAGETLEETIVFFHHLLHLAESSNFLKDALNHIDLDQLEAIAYSEVPDDLSSLGDTPN